MATLQLSRALTHSEKAFLRTTQLQHYILECMSGDDSEEEARVRSVDSINERNSSVIPSPQSYGGGMVPPLHPLKTIVGKALSQLNSPLGSKQSDGREVRSFELKKRLRLKEVMDGLKHKKWVYMNHLLGFLAYKRPLEYLSFPALYDELGSALVGMNQDSALGLLEVYKRSTLWLHEDLSAGFPRFSNFHLFNDKHLFLLPVGTTLKSAFDPASPEVRSVLRLEPEG